MQVWCCLFCGSILHLDNNTSSLFIKYLGNLYIKKNTQMFL